MIYCQWTTVVLLKREKKSVNKSVIEMQQEWATCQFVHQKYYEAAECKDGVKI